MMLDRREQILARLRVIIEEVPGIRSAGRNRDDVQGRSRPAILMHDAAEDTAALSNRPSGRNTKNTKDLMTLSPQLYVMLGATADLVGGLISDFRRQLIPLVWTDAQLWDLVGGNGDIRYLGCGLDTTTGESREARLEVKFEFTYMLDCKELTG